jgi:hypothetical protein
MIQTNNLLITKNTNISYNHFNKNVPKKAKLAVFEQRKEKSTFFEKFENLCTAHFKLNGYNEEYKRCALHTFYHHIVIETLEETEKIFFQVNIENLYHFQAEQSVMNLRTDRFSLWLRFNEDSKSENFRKFIEKFCIFNDLDLVFKIIKKIDKGGFGTVYQAQNKFTGKMVALKKIDKTNITTVKNYVREKSIKNRDICWKRLSTQGDWTTRIWSISTRATTSKVTLCCVWSS